MIDEAGIGVAYSASPRSAGASPWPPLLGRDRDFRNSSARGGRLVLSGTMNRTFAFWTAFVSAFVASGLALRVALGLGLAAHFGGESLVSELTKQSRVAAVAGLAALVSAIAQIIEKASK